MTSVCVCTHNPNWTIFERCLESLRHLRLDGHAAEIVIVDNASSPALEPARCRPESFPCAFRILREPQLGLTAARMRALRESRGGTLIFADDDNLLFPGYVAATARFFAAQPRAGAIGGRNYVAPEAPLPPWFDDQLLTYLAVRDLGPEPQKFAGAHTPYGAGLAVRREVLEAVHKLPFVLGDRTGSILTSGGDSELCYRAQWLGWELWYAPGLELHHVMPEKRLTFDYLWRLNEGFGRDRPRLESYWYPGTPWRRLSYLRRALAAARAARGADSARTGAPASPEDAHRRLESAFQSGLAAGFRAAVFGPSFWQTVRAFRRHAEARRANQNC